MMDKLAIEAAEEATNAGFPTRRRRGAGRRARRRRGRVRGALRRGRARCCEDNGADSRSASPRDEAERAADLAGAQGGVRRDGPDRAQLLRPGRRHPAHPAARGARPDRRARRRVRAAGRQRLPRRRRQPAPARLLRRRDGGRGRSGPRSSRAGSSRPASRPAARSPASTASASTRSATCRRCSPRPTSAAFQRLRCAFDPDGLANPGKVMPTPRLCGEVPGPYRQHPLEAAGMAERF